MGALKEETFKEAARLANSSKDEAKLVAQDAQAAAIAYPRDALTTHRYSTTSCTLHLSTPTRIISTPASQLSLFPVAATLLLVARIPAALLGQSGMKT